MSKKIHRIWSSDFDMADWERDIPMMIEEGDIEEDATEEEIEEYCRELHYDYLDDEKANLNYPCTIIGVGSVGIWHGYYEGVVLGNNLNEIFTMSGVNADCYVDAYVETDKLKVRFAHHDCPTGYTLTFYIVKEDVQGCEKFLESLREGNAPTEHQLKRYCRSAGRKVKEIYGWK